MVAKKVWRQDFDINFCIASCIPVELRQAFYNDDTSRWTEILYVRKILHVQFIIT